MHSVSSHSTWSFALQEDESSSYSSSFSHVGFWLSTMPTPAPTLQRWTWIQRKHKVELTHATKIPTTKSIIKPSFILEIGLPQQMTSFTTLAGVCGWGAVLKYQIRFHIMYCRLTCKPYYRLHTRPTQQKNYQHHCFVYLFQHRIHRIHSLYLFQSHTLYIHFPFLLSELHTRCTDSLQQY